MRRSCRPIIECNRPPARASRLSLLAWALLLALLSLTVTPAARAQTNPTPGAPSLPLLAPALANGVQNRITYQHGIEFVTIGATHNGLGNPAYTTANPNEFVNGRGSVSYEYRLGRSEVTTAQWVEFFNAAYDRPGGEVLPHLLPPDHWGAAPTQPINPGGQRWTVPAGKENIPVGDISWRMAAMYCNWLHNDKSVSREAFMSGAYDVSTFGWFGNIFTDQLAHSPGARFWIPTWDEWLKAAHYDPNKNGVDSGGWWTYANTRDAAPIYGPPGLGEANAGFTSPSPYQIALGAYAGVSQSPWGLLDTAGGQGEWTETVQFSTGGVRARFWDGSYRGMSAFTSGLADGLRGYGSEFPSIATLEFGLRVAAVVPSPGTGLALVSLSGTLVLRRRRIPCCGTHSPSSPVLR